MAMSCHSPYYSDFNLALLQMLHFEALKLHSFIFLFMPLEVPQKLEH